MSIIGLLNFWSFSIIYILVHNILKAVNILQGRVLEERATASQRTAPSDNNSYVTIRVLKELMRKVESNINANINQMVGGIKEDVSEINVQLERLNESSEEMQERLSSVEDKVVKVDELGEEVKKLRKLLETSLSDKNLEACLSKK